MISRIIKFNRISLKKINENCSAHNFNTFKNLKTEREKWNFINEARNSKKSKTEISSLKNVFGDIYTDQNKIVNLLNYRFSKLGDYLGSKQIPYRSSKEIVMSKSLMFEFEPISIYTCKKFLKELHPCKPLGPSEIPAWALKDSISTIAEPLWFLINAFLDEGRFPSECKRADVCPVFKKSDTEDPSNYRPISITAAISKIFEKVIREQIMEYLNKNKLLSQVQFGFRKNFSASDALVYATEKIRKEIDCNQIVTAAFLDLSKAFDSISHEILLEKLKELHFDKKAVSLIESFLIGRTQRVVLSTSTSD